MRALKLRLFQETVCYRKPFAMKIAETYPLPPYSTVNGLLHKLLDATEYIPFKISIQGQYESLGSNYQTTYFYKKNTITSMPMNNHFLFNVNLIIHIMADENILEQLYEKFCHLDEFLSLGRKEDLARIDEVSWVNLKEYEVDSGIQEEEDGLLHSYTIKYPIYIPKEQLEDEEVTGIHYRLNSHYLEKAEIRQWKKIDVVYVEKDNQITIGNILLDDTAEKDIVYFQM